MEFKVYQVGHPLQRSPLGDLHNKVFTELGLPIVFEPCEVPPVNFHRVMSGILRDPQCLGAKLLPPYKQTALAYCQEVSHTAQGIGAINTLIRRPSGLIYGHNTDVAAFMDCLKEEGVKRVRTAIILGAGGAARVAIAALRDFGCARFLVGYRLPRRPSELSSHFKGIRRQMTFFPLQEMTEFFSWAEQANVLGTDLEEPAPRQQKSRGDENSDGLKRWSLLVNATPLGLPELHGPFPIQAPVFCRSADRIFDMVPSMRPTELVSLAQSLDVPVIPGIKLYEKQSNYSRDLWIKEYNKSMSKKSISSTQK